MSASGMYNKLRKDFENFNWKILSQDKTYFPTELHTCGFVGSKYDGLDAFISIEFTPQYTSIELHFGKLARTASNFELINEFNISGDRHNIAHLHHTSCVAGIDTDDEDSFVINVEPRKFKSPKELSLFLSWFLFVLNGDVKSGQLRSIVEQIQG